MFDSREPLHQRDGCSLTGMDRRPRCAFMGGRMSESSDAEKTARRRRYRGTNPRRFEDKYKERRPDLYPDDVAKVIAGGKTPAGSHRPIMVREILEVLSPKPGERAVDCTLGHGGHAREILGAVQPGGRLIALDLDPVEGPKSEARLRAMGYPEESLIVRRMNFSGLAGVIAAEATGGVDVVVADLGLSSMQIDDPARGFSFKDDGPLDMRMNPGSGRSAADLLRGIDESALTRILEENGDEVRAASVAAAIVRARARRPLAMTRQLSTVVSEVYARRPEIEVKDAIRRVFQAIRIAVNDEFKSLEALLRTIPRCLRSGGRVAILTFHSGEDRRVKSSFKEGLNAGIYSQIAAEVIRASAEERRANPRSTSAKLRFAIRSDAGLSNS